MARGSVRALLARGAVPKPAQIFYVRADGSSQIAASGLNFPNGPAITADGRTLIVAETFGARLPSQ